MVVAVVLVLNSEEKLLLQSKLTKSINVNVKGADLWYSGCCLYWASRKCRACLGWAGQICEHRVNTRHLPTQSPPPLQLGRSQTRHLEIWSSTLLPYTLLIAWVHIVSGISHPSSIAYGHFYMYVESTLQICLFLAVFGHCIVKQIFSITPSCFSFFYCYG